MPYYIKDPKRDPNFEIICAPGARDARDAGDARDVGPPGHGGRQERSLGLVPKMLAISLVHYTVLLDLCNNMLGLVPKIHTISLVHYTLLLDLCNKMLTIVASLSL